MSLELTANYQTFAVANDPEVGEALSCHSSPTSRCWQRLNNGIGAISLCVASTLIFIGKTAETGAEGEQDRSLLPFGWGLLTIAGVTGAIALYFQRKGE